MALCLNFCQMKLETTGSLIAYVPGRVLDVGELINIFSMWLLGIKEFTRKYASSTTMCARPCGSHSSGCASFETFLLLTKQNINHSNPNLRRLFVPAWVTFLRSVISLKLTHLRLQNLPREKGGTFFSRASRIKSATTC